MRQSIRSSGAGKQGEALAFVRSIATPRAGLVLRSAAELPGDWPMSPDTGNVEDNLGHGLGWTLEIRRTDVVLLNPLGEGAVKAGLPDLDDSWLQSVRADGSCAVFLAPPSNDTTADGAIKSAAGSGRAATVRTAIADDYGKVDPVGRNEPCTCGSGRKFKHCCG